MLRIQPTVHDRASEALNRPPTTTDDCASDPTANTANTTNNANNTNGSLYPGERDSESESATSTSESESDDMLRHLSCMDASCMASTDAEGQRPLNKDDEPTRRRSLVARVRRRLRTTRTRSEQDAPTNSVANSENDEDVDVDDDCKRTTTTTTTTSMNKSLVFATVCINNVNRSMAAHAELQRHGLQVCSFGAGKRVCFPGRSLLSPRFFSFQESYDAMYQTLQAEDQALFTGNGVLSILDRDRQIKRGPQRWQLLSSKKLRGIDVVVCLDYQMFLAVLEDLRMRIQLFFRRKTLHIICMDVEDTLDDAMSGAALTLELCQTIDQLEEVNEDTVKAVVVQFEAAHETEILYVGLRV